MRQEGIEYRGRAVGDLRVCHRGRQDHIAADREERLRVVWPDLLMPSDPVRIQAMPHTGLVPQGPLSGDCRLVGAFPDARRSNLHRGVVPGPYLGLAPLLEPVLP